MKKVALIILCIAHVLVGCQKPKIKYEDGVYQGEGEGHHGLIKVEVTVESARIKEIEILEDYEIPGLREIVYKQLPKRIIKENTWDVDGISGATLTSQGLKEAIENALEDVLLEEVE